LLGELGEHLDDLVTDVPRPRGRLSDRPGDRHTAENVGERSRVFPAIEKKHGKPMKHWFTLLTKLGDAKYADQLSALQEHGFSRAHANAVVMHHRGSTTSRRHDSVDDLLDSLGPEHRDLIRRIFAAIMKEHPRLELVVAWNQPMLKCGKDYVIGVSAAKNHLTIGPWGDQPMTVFAEDFAGYDANKKTFRVPLDWKVDSTLLNRLVRYRLDEIT
jgi:uncharacterized protein YdhG (YjbR/CyaY superfamily)